MIIVKTKLLQAIDYRTLANQIDSKVEELNANHAIDPASVKFHYSTNSNEFGKEYSCLINWLEDYTPDTTILEEKVTTK